MLITVLLVFIVGEVLSVPLNSEPKETCGYDSCNQASPDMLNVHIVAHTHDDVGWLKTVDQYYYGARNNIQKAGVQYIIDSVVKSLWENPKRRFIYVEIAFFWKWWVRQPKEVQDKVHTLVREGRLQFVGGAWSMNDEAASHYQSTIDQFTWGLRKLNDTFGPCGRPRVGWQIDPFGHSREFASLLAGMGYDGLFLGRIDYQDKQHRLAERTMEMLWRGDDSLGKQSDLFTGVLYNTYQAPPGFCFDVLCDDEPMIDDPDSPMYNIEEKVESFLKFVMKQEKAYQTKNVIITMGGDFTYQDADMWYYNLDKLIEYTNVKAAKDGLNIKLFYSTPDCYLKAVKDANPSLPTKQDDFFPYASDPHAYWTGYFTSRPTTKYFERQGNNYLQIAKQLQTLAGLPEHNMFLLNELKSAMGIMQHHDAITGTEKQHVTHDYERILHQAIEDALAIPNQAFNKFIHGNLAPPFLTYQRCRLNESSCDVTESSSTFIVTVYNSLAWFIPTSSVNVPVVGDGQFTVTGPDGKEVVSQLVDIPSPIKNIPTRQSKATHELVFLTSLPALGYKSFHITKKQDRLKRNANKRNLRDFYSNINEYWEDIKDKSNVDITKADDSKNPENFQSDLPIKLKTKPLYQSYDNNEVKIERIDEADLNVLKDDKETVSDDILMLEELIKEAKFGSVKGRSRERSVSYPSMSEEELRMLSDDPEVIDRHEEKEFMTLGSEKRKLRIHKDTGIMELTVNDATYKINLGIFYYPGCVGDNREFQNRSSGAYIFRPNATEAKMVELKRETGPEGPIVSEYRYIGENAYQVIRGYENITDYFEYEWLIGPIDINDGIGKEYITRLGVSELITNGEFYTDSNGRQDLKRKLNKRPQWNVTIAEPIAGNYYPVNNKISIEGNSLKYTLVTDRSQGGSSLAEGQMELMLHRRLLHDDAFGVGEALNETANGFGLVVRGKMRLYIHDAEHSAANEKMDVLKMHLEPQIFVANSEGHDLSTWLKMKNEYSFLKTELPYGVHLLTLEPWNESKLLIRFENIHETTDKDNSPIQIDFANIFKDIKVNLYRETTLSANQWMDDYKKWEWSTEDEFSANFNAEYGNFNSVPKANEGANSNHDDDFKINIKPKQIRTFIVDYTLNNP